MVDKGEIVQETVVDITAKMQGHESKGRSMRVIEILKAHLETNGFDGLVQPEGECGCELSDLRPCGSDFGDCRPAYRHPDPSGEGDWVMSECK